LRDDVLLLRCLLNRFDFEPIRLQYADPNLRIDEKAAKMRVLPWAASRDAKSAGNLTRGAELLGICGVRRIGPIPADVG
jgi:hypothetical protein